MPADPPADTEPPSLLAAARPWLIGVLHLPALPGAPSARLPVDRIAAQAAEDAALLADAGFSAVLREDLASEEALHRTAKDRIQRTDGAAPDHRPRSARPTLH